MRRLALLIALTMPCLGCLGERDRVRPDAAPDDVPAAGVDEGPGPAAGDADGTGRDEAGAEADPLRLSDEPRPPDVDAVPGRLPPLFELGDPFYGRGPLSPGWVAPTGEVLQPSFQVFGQMRSALQTFDTGDRTSEWANRLDIFGNIQLSGTERILVGMRPLSEGGSYSGYVFDDGDEGWQNDFNARLTTLFFEGSLDEMFPSLDPGDASSNDIGIVVGRIPLFLQDGILADADIDAVGLTRNTLRPPGFSNLRVAGLVGWDALTRGGDREEHGDVLYGVLSEADVGPSTVSLDALWMDDSRDTDAIYAGGGSVQRLAELNTTFRAAGSFPFHGESSAVRRGGLLVSELSHTVDPIGDLVYLNSFWGMGEFTSAVRGPDRGGPLGPVGILYSSPRLGDYPAALGSQPDDSVGFALGYQGFVDEEHRTQWILETGARADTDGSDRNAIAAGFRLEHALGNRTLLRFGGSVTGREEQSPATAARSEIEIRF